MIRRRRLVVGVSALLVLGLLVWGGIAAVQGIVATAQDAIAQNQKGAAEPAATAAAEEEPAEPSPTASEVVAEGPCADDEIKINAVTDKKSYDEGQKPKLTLRVQNTSKAACSIDVGTSQQEFVVASKGGQVWSSADCQDVNADQETARNEVAFAPGETKDSVLEWGVLPSTQGCTVVKKKIGPGDYQLKVHLGSKNSKAAKFAIANPKDDAKDPKDDAKKD